MEANQAAEAKGAGKMGSQLEALLESKGKGKVKAQAKGGGSRVEASSENASHQASFITPNGGSAHVKVNGPKEGAAPVPAAEPKSSSETAPGWIIEVEVGLSTQKIQKGDRKERGGGRAEGHRRTWGS